jgi:hypothetical protein
MIPIAPVLEALSCASPGSALTIQSRLSHSDNHSLKNVEAILQLQSRAKGHFQLLQSPILHVHAQDAEPLESIPPLGQVIPPVPPEPFK